MFAQTILEFAGYLNEAGYSVTPDKTAQCIASFADEDADCTDRNDVLSAMRFYFCINMEQRADLPMHFNDFITQKDAQISASMQKKRNDETKKEIAHIKEEHGKKREEINGKIKALEAKMREIEDDVRRQWQPDPAIFSKKDYAFLSKKKRWIDSLDLPNVEEILSGSGVTLEQSVNAQKQVLQMAEDSMRSGNLKKMSDLKELFSILKKLSTVKKGEAPKLEKAVDSATSDTRQKIQSLMKIRREADEEHDRIQAALSRRLKQVNAGAVIVKPRSVSHRDEFIGGRNYVRTFASSQCPPEAEKEFKRLSEQDKKVIYRYIHENILKFKTRLSRNIMDMDSGRIDMGMTIRNACRTGGLPFDIFREMKRPGKANLILILDVSGSCREASEMMLTFMYMLQEVFPRGCRAYAFVNSLYDITQIMDSKDEQAAISEALSIIPRAGVYSNYGKPIRSLWEENKEKITKESLVIMIGDARNNKNPSAEAEFRNIARRCKKMYWMNTDHFEKWGQGDSIAPVYAKYCRMFEIRTPKAIVQFLNDGMR